MKRMAALVLCLSLLIGIPCAVQAGKPGGFRLMSAFAMTNSFDISYNQAEHTANAMHNHRVVLYFTEQLNTTTASIAKFLQDDSVKFYIEAYNAEKTIAIAEAAFASFTTYSGTKSPVVSVGFGTNTDGTFVPAEMGFKEYMDAGATNFRLHVMNNRGENDNDGAVEGFCTTNSYNWPLTGAKQWTNPAGKTDDTVSVEIVFATHAKHPKGSVNLTALNNYLYIESTTQTSDTTYMLKFNKNINVNAAHVTAKLQLMDAVRINDNGEPANATGTALRTVQKTAVAESLEVVNGNWLKVTFDETAASEVLTGADLKNVFLQFVDSDTVKNATNVNSVNGAQDKNGLIDGIWSEADINRDGIWNYEPLVKTDGRNRTDGGGDSVYVHIGTHADDSVAWSEKGVYDSVDAALKAAESGNTVVLGQNATVGDRFLEVPAGVTLDLNGKNLTVANIFSFGDIIDSTDGKGSLVISNDKTQAFVGLQETNSYLPLYDTNCYRFFDYDVVSAGKETGTNTVKFGVKVNFNNEKAYELLQNDGELVLDLMIGEQNIPYKFNSATMTKLYDAVTADWTNRSKYAIALTISGLDNLASGTAITATPELTSAGVLGTDEAIEYTYTSAQ